jgi:hypothetical protein
MEQHTAGGTGDARRPRAAARAGPLFRRTRRDPTSTMLEPREVRHLGPRIEEARTTIEPVEAPAETDPDLVVPAPISTPAPSALVATTAEPEPDPFVSSLASLIGDTISKHRSPLDDWPSSDLDTRREAAS